MATIHPEHDTNNDDSDFTQPPSASGAHLIQLPNPPPNYSDNPPVWNGPAGWSVYFPGQLESGQSSHTRAAVVASLKRYFLTEHGQRTLSGLPENSFALPLDYHQVSHSSAPSPLRSVAADIQQTPDEALPSIGLAACRAAEQLSAAPNATNFYAAQDLSVSRQNRLWPRLYNHTPLTPLRSLRGNSVGTFVSVRGTVVRVSNIRQQLVSMLFECARCRQRHRVSFPDYKYGIPTKCATERCRSRSFAPIREYAETTDWQKIRIQELQENDHDFTMREEGRMPRTIDAELFDDLIDTCIPGDIATLGGVVRVLTIEGGRLNNRSAKCLYYMYIEANSISTSRQKNSSVVVASTPIGREVEESETLAIHKVIREVVREKDPFGFLVHSLVPSIYGHEIVKAGMLLSLFGGAPKERVGPSGSEPVAIRRDIHCLIVGDPGLGKSQMLKALANVAPRGVYVCGNTTSTAGLTVTVVRETSGDFALEAGALVLGDRGICCIDEFDKMGAEHGALLEAMEQQSVSVAKAGLLCNLSARTTVVAAANPVGGHYDRSRTVCENLKMPLPLLSRFDLVFILMDKADAARDRFISEHVMKMFGMRATERSSATVWRKGRRVLQQDTRHDRVHREGAMIGPNLAENRTTTSLQERLRGMKVHDPLPPSLFRQYISYARTHVNPKLSDGAKRELQDTYLQMRKAAHEQAADTTPITTRQLESLIRLSEARARAVMRTVVTAEDAREVIEIMRASMVDTLTDETGNLDLGRSTGMSRSKDARRFINALNSEAKRVRNGVFDRRGLKHAAERIGISGERFERLLETVNHQGYLMMRGSGRWELQGCEFGGDGTQARRTQGRESEGWKCQSISNTQGLSQHSIARRAMRRGSSSSSYCDE